MYVAVLGPLEVEHEDRPIQVAGARLRRLLTRLAVDAGRAVSTAELVDAVWPDDPPVETANSLQSLVSRLRRALGGPDVIAQVASGYLLHVPASMTDIHRFSELVRTGQRQLSADPTSAEVDLNYPQYCSVSVVWCRWVDVRGSAIGRGGRV